MADGEDEPEFKVDQQLLESHNFALYKHLEGYHCLWKTWFVPSKQAGRKAKRLEELSQKYNFSPSNLKRKRASYCRRELRWHGKLRRK